MLKNNCEIFINECQLLQGEFPRNIPENVTNEHEILALAPNKWYLGKTIRQFLLSMKI